MTALAISIADHDADVVLSLLGKLREMNLVRARGRAQAGRPLPPKVPVVQCKPWCEDGDGHPDCYCMEDQQCWSPGEYVELSRESVHTEGDDQFPHRIGVMARQEPATPGEVYEHLDGIPLPGPVPFPWDVLDKGLRLAPAEARRLAASLMASADLIDPT